MQVSASTLEPEDVVEHIVLELSVNGCIYLKIPLGIVLYLPPSVLTEKHLQRKAKRPTTRL